MKRESPDQPALHGLDEFVNRGTMTPGGYALDEVVSALQKAVRRGEEEAAMYWALEMEDKFYSYLWRRLSVMASEDIGLADPMAAVVVSACRANYLFVRSEHGRTRMPLSQAILYLCRAKKNRQCDHFFNVIRQRKENGWRLEIPDHALDKHTRRGRSMGRDDAHFWNGEPSKLENETPMGGGERYRYDPTKSTKGAKR